LKINCQHPAAKFFREGGTRARIPRYGSAAAAQQIGSRIEPSVPSLQGYSFPITLRPGYAFRPEC